ncbi:MAG: hypothetical protein RQ899_11180 [Pseudomonadales bacterium]|nr:hypothetical protein [Pseudomonadales bacterium]
MRSEDPLPAHFDLHLTSRSCAMQVYCPTAQITVFAIDPRVSWLVFVLMILMIAITFIVRLKGSRWRSPERLRRILAEDII